MDRLPPAVPGASAVLAQHLAVLTKTMPALEARRSSRAGKVNDRVAGSEWVLRA